MVTRRVAALLALWLVFTSTVAHAAGGWPIPAAGPSASGGPELVLTFDDGPNPSTTPKVLDVLAAHHLHATFFLVGRSILRGGPRERAIVARMVAEGNIVGNHTMSHAHMCLGTPEVAAAEIDDAHTLLEQTAGMPIGWFRTPYGARCTRLEEMLAARNLKHFHWDLDPQEWKHHNVDMAFYYVTSRLLDLQDRAVLLMHDIHVTTARALPRILDWIDQENVRRRATGARPIRIVQGYELAREQLPAGTGDVLAGLVASVDLRASIAAALP